MVSMMGQLGHPQTSADVSTLMCLCTSVISMVSRGADRAIQAMKAMELHQDDELALGFGTLSVATNGEDRGREPEGDVSTLIYAAFVVPCHWNTVLKPIRLSISPEHQKEEG